MGRLGVFLVSVVAMMAAGSAQAAPIPLTPGGWGDLRIGMREAEAVARFHLVVPPDDGVNGVECRELTFPKGGPPIVVMTQNRRVTRLSLYGPSGLKTDHGVGVGSRERDVRKAYAGALKVEPHAYEEAPAHYLTAWDAKTRRGVRFETNSRGVVGIVHVGDDSIRLIESCL